MGARKYKNDAEYAKKEEPSIFRNNFSELEPPI
jgi:hypothetical protein